MKKQLLLEAMHSKQRRGNTLKKPTRFQGRLPKTENAIVWLKTIRKSRHKRILAESTFWGLVFGAEALAKTLWNNESYSEGIRQLAYTGADVATVVAGVSYLRPKENGGIQRATRLVGVGLCQEVKKNNQELIQFLKQHKYTIIDRNGEIAGTNRKRFWILGRIRLDNQKILHGEYIVK